METILLQSVAATAVGRGYLTSDHLSTATGLDPAIMISKNGGNFANPAAGASVMMEIEATGWYKFALGTGDTDTLGPLIIRGTHDTMDNIEVVYQVVVASTAANVVSVANDAITAASINTGALTADAFAADAIIAATLATGALTADAFASDSIVAATIKADAVTKIQNGLATPTNITAGTIATVTNLTNLPTMPADWLTAAGLKADAVTEIAAGITIPAASDIADAVWDEPDAEHVTAGTTGLRLRRPREVRVDGGGNVLSDARLQKLDELTNLLTDERLTKLDNLDATVSSRIDENKLAMAVSAIRSLIASIEVPIPAPDARMAFLDAPVSTRATPDDIWQNFVPDQRLANLDVPVSSRAGKDELPTAEEIGKALAGEAEIIAAALKEEENSRKGILDRNSKYLKQLLGD